MSWLVPLVNILRREKEHARLMGLLALLALLGLVAHLVLSDVLPFLR
jgi:hypothetical protein